MEERNISYFVVSILIILLLKSKKKLFERVKLTEIISFLYPFPEQQAFYPWEKTQFLMPGIT